MPLPPREKDVLNEIKAGQKGRVEIAHNLHLSPRTVGNYIQHLRKEGLIEATTPDMDLRKLEYRVKTNV
jgi:DNA-binding CsgD family transcriptional regulator